jgi:hypothetical protein
MDILNNDMDFKSICEFKPALPPFKRKVYLIDLLTLK